jgi:hypothetical protein
MLNLIKQNHKNSCVPACIATIKNLSYSDSLKAVHPKRKSERWNTNGTHYNQIYYSLKRMKISFRKRKVISLHKLRNNAIVITKGLFRPDRCHAVVWDVDRQRILDPDPESPSFSVSNFYQKFIVNIIEIR